MHPQLVTTLRLILKRKLVGLADQGIAIVFFWAIAR